MVLKELNSFVNIQKFILNISDPAFQTVDWDPTNCSWNQFSNYNENWKIIKWIEYNRKDSFVFQKVVFFDETFRL